MRKATDGFNQNNKLGQGGSSSSSKRSDGVLGLSAKIEEIKDRKGSRLLPRDGSFPLMMPAMRSGGGVTLMMPTRDELGYKTILQSTLMQAPLLQSEREMAATGNESRGRNRPVGTRVEGDLDDGSKQGSRAGG